MIGNWLLCDFHIHTTFSDGLLRLEDVVTLYGENSFDAIGISDHLLDDATVNRCKAEGITTQAIAEEEFPGYLRCLWKEARRAWNEFGMLLIPGAEITNNTWGYHILVMTL